MGNAQWNEMSGPERKRLAAQSGSPANLVEEMQRVTLHKDYCADIAAKARDVINALHVQRGDLEARMKKITEDKAAENRMSQEEKVRMQTRVEERRLEMEEQALQPMEGA